MLLALYASLTSGVSTWQQMGSLLRAFVWAVSANNVAALAIYAVTFQTGAQVGPWNYGWRLSGLLIDPNAYGGLLVLATGFHLFLGAPAKSVRGVLLHWLILLSLLTGIALTFSRSAWWCLAILGFLCFLTNRTAALRLSIMAIVAVALTSSIAGERFLGIAAAMTARPDQVEQRFDLANQAWDAFRESPLVGNGLGYFFGFGQTMIHNTTLMFLSEMGIVGFTIFGGLSAWYLIESWRLQRAVPRFARGIATSLFAGQIVMLALSMGIEAFYQRHWWMTMALIGAARAIQMRQAAPLPVSWHDDPRKENAVWVSAPLSCT